MDEDEYDHQSDINHHVFMAIFLPHMIAFILILAVYVAWTFCRGWVC